MSRQQGDICPHCNKGHLTVHPDREVRESKKGSTSHRTWLCDSCGKICKDLYRGINESVGITEDVDVKKS